MKVVNPSTRWTWNCRIGNRMALASATAASLLCGAAAAGPPAVCVGNDSGSCFIPHANPGCSDQACCAAVCAMDSFCCNVSWDGICADEALPICIGDCQPACEPPKLNLECINPSLEYNNRTFVGRINITCNAGAGNTCMNAPASGGDSIEDLAVTCCTGWIAGAPDFIVSNAHCVFSNASYEIEFNYECDKCVNGDLKPRTKVALTLLFVDPDLDVAIFRPTTPQNLVAAWGQAKIDSTPLEVDDPLYEIHHAKCQPKGYDDGKVLQLYQNVGCPGNVKEHKVSIIAAGGASGSPVFRYVNDCVSGICNCGPTCAEGFILPMDLVWPTLKAKILANGGTVMECAGASCPLSDHNCFTTGVPGCTDVACCDAVCEDDPFCCDVAWDSICVDEAADICDGCGHPKAGDCCSAQDGPFCDDRDCCDAICAFDPFCCETAWDSICALEASEQPECDCAFKSCYRSDESCFESHDTPGCDSPACCVTVCAIDLFCCNTAWDSICKDEANELCADCGGPDAGCCFGPHDNPGCNSAECCRAVCEKDPFCCEVAWDDVCAGEAVDLCPCRADFTGNGDVGPDDLGLLLGAWDSADPCYDINEDGIVDGADLGILLRLWDPCEGPG